MNLTATSNGDPKIQVSHYTWKKVDSPLSLKILYVSLFIMKPGHTPLLPLLS